MRLRLANGGIASKELSFARHGKPEAFRTSGSKAAENQLWTLSPKSSTATIPTRPSLKPPQFPPPGTRTNAFEVRKQTVFSHSWQFGARVDQLTNAGNYVTTEIAGEPIVIVRGSDGELRAFFNVCRHHAAAVMTEPEGRAPQLRCPYHGGHIRLKAAKRHA